MADDDEVIDGEIVEEAALAPQAMSALAKAEIDMAISTAHRFPRAIKKARDRMIEMATLDEETASECSYALKRKEANGQMKVISGPSVRMAEIALSAYGNARVAVRSAGQTDDGKFILMQAVCHDLERNVAVTVEVARRITTKTGRPFGDDMIGVTMAAAGSIARRNAILAVIPRAVVKPAIDKAREVALGKTKSLVVRRGEVLARLAKLSPLITTERALEAVGKAAVEEIGWDDIGLLLEMGVSVKDGTPVEEVFPDPSAEAAAVKPSSIRSAAAKAKAETAAVGPAASVRLPLATVANLYEYIADEGVSVDAVEGRFGCTLAEVDGTSESEITGRIKAAVAAERGK